MDIRFVGLYKQGTPIVGARVEERQMLFLTHVHEWNETSCRNMIRDPQHSSMPEGEASRRADDVLRVAIRAIQADKKLNGYECDTPELA